MDIKRAPSTYYDDGGGDNTHYLGADDYKRGANLPDEFNDLEFDGSVASGNLEFIILEEDVSLPNQ